MIRRLCIAVIIGSVLLSTAAPAIKAAAPTATTQVVVSKPKNPIAAPGGSERSVPLMVSVATDETPPLTDLGRRVTEKGAGVFGFYAGLAAGTAVGAAMFGPVGAALGGPLGAFFGSVLGEFLGAQWSNPSAPPRWAIPKMP
jgi:hypothetical protein